MFKPDYYVLMTDWSDDDKRRLASRCAILKQIPDAKIGKYKIEALSAGF